MTNVFVKPVVVGKDGDCLAYGYGLNKVDRLVDSESVRFIIPCRANRSAAYRRSIMAGNVQEFTDTNFEQEVLTSDHPVLVDFWAPWCGPCRMIAPMVEELAKENTGSFKIGKINIDDNPNVAQNYGVSAIPTLMIFKNGEVVERFVGVRPKNQLQSAIDQAKG